MKNALPFHLCIKHLHVWLLRKSYAFGYVANRHYHILIRADAHPFDPTVDLVFAEIHPLDATR